MGLAILEGDRPIMLKNQTYGAAWEPYVMAAVYTLFGISRVSAKLPVLGMSLLCVWATWLLTRELAGKLAARFAALLVALPPIYVLVLSLKPWAPYTEVILLGTVSLLGAVRIAFPHGGQRDWRWSLLAGVSGGLAFWMHPLAVYYLLPAATFVLWRARRARLAQALALGLSGFAVGALPVWVYNLQTGGATFRFVLAGSGGATANKADVLAAWWNADLPRALGLWNPWGGNPLGLQAATALLLLAAMARAIARGRLSVRPLDLALLTLILMPTLFVLSGFGGPALNPYGFDATGRYAPPLWYAAAPVAGWLLASAWQQRRAAGAGLLVLALAGPALAWWGTDPVLAFQSPYWARLPVDNGPLLRVLKAEGVQFVWLNHWAAFPLMFDARAAGQPLIAYDWYDVQAGGIDRFPEYLPRMERAARPAFVLVTDEAQPELPRRLDALGVRYIMRRIAPYVVVVPTSRRVLPAEVAPALDYRY